MKNRAQPPRNDLHFIYGINCYQFAIGDYTPYVCAYRQDDEKVTLTYLSMTPGDPTAPQPSFEDPPTPSDLEAYKASVAQGCLADGLINTGTTFEQKEGHTTVSLLFDTSNPSFHFLKYSNGDWLSKFSMGWVTRYPSLEEAIKETQNLTNQTYELRNFFLVPKGTVPLIVRRIETENILARSSDSTLQPLKQFFLEKLSLNLENIPGHSIELDPRKKEALHLDNKKRIPYPAWPLYPGNTLKTDFKKNSRILHRLLGKKSPQSPKPVRLKLLSSILTEPTH